jgi:hypothetical protein
MVTERRLGAQSSAMRGTPVEIVEDRQPLTCNDPIAGADRLVPILEKFNPGDINELHAVYLGQGGLLPIRIRVFLEYLAQHIKIGEARSSKDT